MINSLVHNEFPKLPFIAVDIPECLYVHIYLYMYTYTKYSWIMTKITLNKCFEYHP